MKVYDAIKEMKNRRKTNSVFSFSFMSYSITKNETHGIVNIRKAKLSKRPPEGKNQYGEYMLSFINMDTLEEFHCWTPLLMFFDETKLEL